jgi:hypothetical protein
MPSKYGDDAVELCRDLYDKYNGTNHDAIEREMRKVFPGWSKANLQNKPAWRNRGPRLGWIEEYGYERSLKLKLELKIEAVADDERGLYIGIKKIRQRLERKALGDNASDKERGHYFAAAKLEIEARRNLDLSKANLETYAEAFDLISSWAVDVDPELARRLVKVAPRFTDLAQAHYGKKDGIDDGAGASEDQRGDGESENATRD